MNKFSRYVLIIIMLSLPGTFLFGQIKNNLGVGLNIGGQKLYGDGGVTSKFGPAGGIYAEYSLRKKSIGLNTGLSFGWLDATKGEEHYAPNLLTLDTRGVFWLLRQQSFNPYVTIGLSIINFSYPRKIWDADQKKHVEKRYFDGAFFLGGGFEWLIKPKVALNTSFDYRYTTSEDFDLTHGGVPDGYLNVRVGLTYYFKERGPGKSESLMVEFDEVTPEVEQGVDETNVSNYSMDEFIALQTRVDELAELIVSKENEILETKLLIETKKTNLDKPIPNTIPISEPSVPILSTTTQPIPTQSSGDFSKDYNAGLERFYAHEYDATISIMSSLVKQDPNHHLASNCQYWIGEAYYGKNDNQNAIQSFNKVLAFDNSPKLDDALLMLGKCYYSISDLSNAKQYFNRIITEFPDSEYVEKAKNYLDKL